MENEREGKSEEGPLLSYSHTNLQENQSSALLKWPIDLNYSRFSFSAPIEASIWMDFFSHPIWMEQIERLHNNFPLV